MKRRAIGERLTKIAAALLFGALFSPTILPASELHVTGQYCNGFKVAWQNPADAVSATLHICKTEYVPASFDEISHWSFASVVNTSGNTAVIDDFSVVWPGLGGEVIRKPANSQGVIQLGVYGTRGTVFIPNVTEAVESIIIRSSVRNYGNGHFMLIVSDDGTPVTNRISVTEEMQDYVMDVASPCSIAISPSAKASPLLVADIRLVAAYSPPYILTNSMEYVNVGTRSRWVFRSLSPGDYVVRVGSRRSNDESTEFSSYIPVTLSADDPHMPIGFTISLQ